MKRLIPFHLFTFPPFHLVLKQRVLVKRLILIILAVIAAIVSLSAQAEPLRWGEGVLELPEFWHKTYDPPQVLARVYLNPDSTMSLLRIMDGKDELVPYVEDFLQRQGKAPQDSLFYSARERDLLIVIYQPYTPDSDLSGLEEEEPVRQLTFTREDIDNWIDRQRTDTSLQLPVWDPARMSAFNRLPEPYRFGAFFSGERSAYDALRIRGFRPPQSQFGGMFHASLFNCLYQDEATTFQQNFTQGAYPYEVPLTDIEGGLGAFDHRYARGSLRKNRFIGVDSLQVAFDFNVQNGLWEELNGANTSLKSWISVPLGKSSLELEYADWASDVSMFQLDQHYWQKTNFLIDHRYKQLYAAWNTPWLDLAMLRSHETAKANRFIHTLDSKTTQLRASRSLQTGTFRSILLYEHLWQQSGQPLAYEDLARVELSYARSIFNTELQAECEDFDRLKLDGQLALNWPAVSSGLAVRRVFRSGPALTKVADIYSENAFLPHIDIRCNQDLAAFISVRPGGDSSVNLWLGQKTVESAADSSSTAFQVSKDVWYAALGSRIRLEWKRYNLNWRINLAAQHGTDGLREAPAVAYGSFLNIRRELLHGNALFAGFSLHGHSNFVSATHPVFESGVAALADIWAGFQITPRFELTVSLKNISDGNLWGVYPLPRSLHANIRWFYLN